MTQPLLTIAVPTFNRPKHLRELLDCLVAGLVPLTADEKSLVWIEVRDNASEYDCRGLVAEVLGAVPHRYSRNPSNLGAEGNFLECVRTAETEYVWLLGDDELLPVGSLVKILHVLREKKPALCILSDGNFRYTDTPIEEFSSYGAFMSEVAKRNPYGVVAHSLISCNVFRRQGFQLDFAAAKTKTNYAHMYGLTPFLTGSVYLFPTPVPIIQVREIRAPFEDRVTDLKFKQNQYLAFLGKTWKVPPVRRYALGKLFVLPFQNAAESFTNAKNWLLNQAKSTVKRLLGIQRP